MTDFKKIIADSIAKTTNIDKSEIYGYIEIPNKRYKQRRLCVSML